MNVTHVALLRKGAIVEYGEYKNLKDNERSEFRQFVDRALGTGGAMPNEEEEEDSEQQQRLMAGRAQGEMQSRALELLHEFERSLQEAGDGGDMNELISSLKELRESLNGSTPR